MSSSVDLFSALFLSFSLSAAYLINCSLWVTANDELITAKSKFTRKYPPINTIGIKRRMEKSEKAI